MRHSKTVIIALVVVVLFGGSFFAGMMVYLLMGGASVSDADWFSDGKVGVVTVTGTIIDSKDTIEDIEGFRRDSGISALVLRIESPGGSVAASQEIMEAVKKTAKKKPVVASMGSVAASGGYYIACGATKIFANPGTITGSIGVRMEHVMVGDLLKWMKIRHETLKSGQFKDLASPDRPLTPAEREILEKLLADIHGQFKADVASARNLKDKIDKLADGRIYTGREALKLGLVDELGGFVEAVASAGKLGGIEGEPKAVYPKKRYRFLERILTEGTSVIFEDGLPFVDWWQPMFLSGNYEKIKTKGGYLE